jgi:ABC-type nitrate/sulfonate/bicarbonate transport system substrate-binding protein
MNIKTKPLWKPALVMSLLALVVFITACSGDRGNADPVVSEGEQGSADSAVSESDSPVTIRLSDTITPTELYIPYIAEELGFFEEEGIQIEWTGFVPPQEQVPSVVAGTNDAGFMHENYIIQAVAADVPIIAVAANSKTIEEFPHMEFIALDESGIEGPEDVVGKKVGVVAVNDCNDYTVLEYLRKYTDTEDSRNDVEFVIVPNGNEEAALREKEVDIIGYHGHPEDIFARGGVHVVFDDYDVWEELGGLTAWFFRTEYIEQNPEVVKHFVNAISKANNWSNENVQESREIYAKREDIAVESAATKHYEADAIINPATVEIWNDILLHYESIEAPVPLEKLFTNEYNAANKA